MWRPHSSNENKMAYMGVQMVNSKTLSHQASGLFQTNANGISNPVKFQRRWQIGQKSKDEVIDKKAEIGERLSLHALL